MILEIGDLLQSLQHRLLFRVVNLLAAGVVRPALHIAGPQWSSEMLFEKRNVLEKQLLLQILRAGRYDHALAGENRRNQIGERFSSTRPSFDNEMLLIRKRGFHRLRHFELALAEFVLRMPLRKQSSPAEELADG